MRSGHNNKRGRNRHRPSGGGGNNNGGGNPLSRVYESNGPDVKVRGNAQTVADKYLQLGRDAQSAGDIIMAESYYQYAEHYLRIVAAAQAYNQQMQPQYRGPGGDDDFDEEGGDGNETTQEARQAPQSAEQPEAGAEQPFDGDRQPQQQNYRSQRDYRDQGNQAYGNRDRNQQNQPNQQHQNRDRNYNRPRWQDRRDQQQQPQPQPEIRQPQPQPRIEEQPREQAVNGNVAEETPGQWEAPSFLRRPAPVPAPEPVTAEPEAQPQAQPQAAERKPRAPRAKREKPAEVQTDPAGEVTPQGD